VSRLTPSRSLTGSVKVAEEAKTPPPKGKKGPLGIPKPVIALVAGAVLFLGYKYYEAHKAAAATTTTPSTTSTGNTTGTGSSGDYGGGSGGGYGGGSRLSQGGGSGTPVPASTTSPVGSVIPQGAVTTTTAIPGATKGGVGEMTSTNPSGVVTGSATPDPSVLVPTPTGSGPPPALLTPSRIVDQPDPTNQKQTPTGIPALTMSNNPPGTSSPLGLNPQGAPTPAEPVGTVTNLQSNPGTVPRQSQKGGL